MNEILIFKRKRKIRGNLTRNRNTRKVCKQKRWIVNHINLFWHAIPFCYLQHVIDIAVGSYLLVTVGIGTSSQLCSESPGAKQNQFSSILCSLFSNECLPQKIIQVCVPSLASWLGLFFRCEKLDQSQSMTKRVRISTINLISGVVFSVTYSSLYG